MQFDKRKSKTLKSGYAWRVSFSHTGRHLSITETLKTAGSKATASMPEPLAEVLPKWHEYNGNDYAVRNPAVFRFNLQNV